MTVMQGIDTSFWKKDIVGSDVHIDFVYTKATEGNYYVDDSCDSIVQWAVNRDKKWGVYHFATNRITDAVTEANFFIDNCLGYVHRGMLILDNENYHWSNGTLANDPLDVGWTKAWLDQVYLRTGVKPLVYMSLSVILGADWSPVIGGDYGLICAAYPDNNTPITNFQYDSNRDPNPLWDGKINDVMWQFTSTGRLDGYGGNLDCNFFYGDRAAWDAYAGVQPTVVPPPVLIPDPAPDVQPSPAPEPTVPPAEPVPQAPADPTTPPNAPLPTPTPLPPVLPEATLFDLIITIVRKVIDFLKVWKR